MIDNQNKKFKLICDICEEPCEIDFDNWDEAVDYKQDIANGWQSRRHKFGYDDICPNCKE